MVYGPLTRIGSTSGVAIIVLMDQVILSAQYSAGTLLVKFGDMSSGGLCVQREQTILTYLLSDYKRTRKVLDQ
ncbi:1-aminocyclopropane-1-carboxylate synthase [Trichinella spiralis]|uniref:1-aminocyclopropane-1-carboxylate synthase n=1 Tax=Trichinella spiralis TaxID=6334 RepID=A0ABR3K2T2_TRISP